MFELAFIPANGAIEAAISIAVLVIAFIGWLVQLVGQAKGPQPPAPTGRQGAGQRPARNTANPSRPRDERLQSEIDSFLKEVSSGRKSRPTDDEEVAVEVVTEEPQSPRRLTEQADPFAPPSTSTIAPIFRDSKPAGASDEDRDQQRRRERLLSSLRERHLESTPLGSALQKHVEQTLADADVLRQEKQQVERRLAEANAQLSSLRAGAGHQVALGSGGRGISSPRSRVATLLRNRRTVKDAIVINEVLGRPKGFRRDTGNR